MYIVYKQRAYVHVQIEFMSWAASCGCVQPVHHTGAISRSYDCAPRCLPVALTCPGFTSDQVLSTHSHDLRPSAKSVSGFNGLGAAL